MKKNFFAVMFALALTSCAAPYNPAPQLLPEHIKKVYVKPVVNNTNKYGLEAKFTNAVVDEILRDGIKTVYSAVYFIYQLFPCGSVFFFNYFFKISPVSDYAAVSRRIIRFHGQNRNANPVFLIVFYKRGQCGSSHQRNVSAQLRDRKSVV